MFQYFKTGISFGSVTHEAQYIVNYTFSILNLFIYLFIFYKKDSYSLKKYVLIAITIYILSIYISIITKTYSPTYVEGIGIKGWFESGNSLGSILIIGLFILLTMVKIPNLNKLVIPIIALIGIFLLMLLGTRVSLFGFIGVFIAYLFSEFFIAIKNKLKINKVTIISLCTIIALIFCLIIVIGSNTFQRRKYLNSLTNSTIDPNTGNSAHITLDLLNIKTKLQNGEISNTYMSAAEIKALNSLYDFANKYQIENTNRRIQQLVYNSYLIVYQSSPISILFGNGLLNNYGELIMEMEIPSFLLNFGLIGFILYFIPFLSIFIYSIYMGIRNFKDIDVEYLILIFGELFTFGLAIVTGIVFFNSSSMILVISLNVLLINKANSLCDLNKKVINYERKEKALVK